MDLIASIITPTTLEKRNKCQKFDDKWSKAQQVAIGYNLQLDEQFTDYRTNAMMYKNLIEVQIRDHATRIGGENFIFQ